MPGRYLLELIENTFLISYHCSSCMAFFWHEMCLLQGEYDLEQFLMAPGKRKHHGSYQLTHFLKVLSCYSDPLTVSPCHVNAFVWWRV